MFRFHDQGDRLTTIVTFVILSVAGMALVAQDSPSPAGKVVKTVWDEFAKAKSDADEKFEKAPAVVNLQAARIKTVERAGRVATTKLERLMADSKRAGSDLGVESASQCIEDVAAAVLKTRLASAGLDQLVVMFKGHSYLPILRPCTWADADKLCREMGGHLAYAADRECMSFLQEQIKGTASSWIGGKREKKGWRWQSGKAIDKLLWESDSTRDNSSGGCTVLTAKGIFNTAPNGVHYAFICEWD